MFVKKVIEIIENLIHLHEKLLTLSKEKTEMVKSKNVDKLPPLLMEEKKLLQQLEKKEEERLTVVTPFFEAHNVLPENRTVTVMLQLIENERDKEQLEVIFAELTEMMINLKHQEQLNNQLIQQSLQLIHLSLGMMNPTIQNMNYSNKKQNDEVRDRSMFDSKA